VVGSHSHILSLPKSLVIVTTAAARLALLATHTSGRSRPRN